MTLKVYPKIAIVISKATIITIGIHIGANTQSQDHAIKLVSLSAINNTVSKPVKPIPP